MIANQLRPAVVWALSLTLIFGSAGVLASSPKVERFRGVAYGENGQVAYRERHEVTYENGRPARALTIYSDPGGKEIARLSTDYGASPYAPAYRFVDKRTGNTQAARRTGSTLVLQNGGETRQLSLPADLPLVLGQGLNQFVRMNLKQLEKGPITVRFAIPSRLDTYQFRVRRVESPSESVVRVRVDMDDWFVRLLAPDIEVDYDRKTGRLLRYRGVSNLDTADGDTQKVVIRYSYPDAAGG